MRIVKDTLEVLVETWEDPGDYPSNAGSGPLPSYKYVAGMEGELVVELSPEDLVVFSESVRDESVGFWVREVLDYDLPGGVSSATWEVVKSEIGGRLTLVVSEVEADPDYGVDEPDYWDEPDWD